LSEGEHVIHLRPITHEAKAPKVPLTAAMMPMSTDRGCRRPPSFLVRLRSQPVAKRTDRSPRAAAKLDLSG